MTHATQGVGAERERAEPEIRITPEMIEAGAGIVRSQFGEITTFEPWLAADVAKMVFLAMYTAHGARETCRQGA